MRRLPRLPALTALRAFEAAARLGSVTAAAAELAVTQGAISRQIRLLEEDLQQPLFRRLHRGLELTAAGQKLSALDDRRLRPDRLRRRRPQAAAGRGLGQGGPRPSPIRWLLPRLADFRRACIPPSSWRSRPPGTGSTSTGRISTAASPAAASQPRTPHFIWVELVKETILPVCTPDYARKMGAPHTAADFARHNLLHPTLDRSDWRPMDGRLGWRPVRCRRRPDLRHHRSCDPRRRIRPRRRHRRTVPAGRSDRAGPAGHAGAGHGVRPACPTGSCAAPIIAERPAVRTCSATGCWPN